MKKMVLLVAVAATIAGCSDVPIDGLTRAGWDGPTSMPPLGYALDTWVDERGCVYFATQTGWVPHIGGNLKQVCR